MFRLKVFGWYFVANIHRPRRVTWDDLNGRPGFVCGPNEIEQEFDGEREDEDLRRLCAIADAANDLIEWLDDARFTFDFPESGKPYTRALYAAVNGLPSAPPAGE